jgi:hypothetical protein
VKRAAAHLWCDPADTTPWPPPAPPRVVQTPEDLERLAEKSYGEHASYPLTIELPRCRCGSVAARCACPPSHKLPDDDAPSGRGAPIRINTDPPADPDAPVKLPIRDLAAGWTAEMQCVHGRRTL